MRFAKPSAPIFLDANTVAENRPRYSLGVDPGISGALALYCPATDHLVIRDMPWFQTKIGRSNRKMLDIPALLDFLDKHCLSVERAWIEDVHAMPRQGVTSSFTFGQTYGATLALLHAFYLPYERVQPQIWKRHFGLIGQTKDRSRETASRLLPTHANKWCRRKDDGRAEAALIALYGSRQSGTV